ncbi:hypothetical protein FACS1894153_4500 [Bacteroidia bacterium]|nr:hypothetical protein FACS1894153_4500 [Bacteroidia bacterium]
MAEMNIEIVEIKQNSKSTLGLQKVAIKKSVCIPAEIVTIKNGSGDVVPLQGNVPVLGNQYEDYIVSSESIIRIPELPLDSSSKTYVLGAVNGVITWIEQ